MNDHELLQCFDAKVWAKDFMERFEHQKEKIDTELMESWFSNAIMMGYDKGFNNGASD